MLQQVNDILRVIADIVALILNFLKPYVIPVGEWMIGWIEVALSVFPKDDLSVYFILCIILVMAGVIINVKFPGDEPPAEFEHKGKTIDDSVKKCKECGNPISDNKVCPYCGEVNN
ncbi:MAG: hypothetical protein ACOC4M_13565 [Promethearchaeia archaeon]